MKFQKWIALGLIPICGLVFTGCSNGSIPNSLQGSYMIKSPGQAGDPGRGELNSSVKIVHVKGSSIYFASGREQTPAQKKEATREAKQALAKMKGPKSERKDQVSNALSTVDADGLTDAFQYDVTHANKTKHGYILKGHFKARHGANSMSRETVRELKDDHNPLMLKVDHGHLFVTEATKNASDVGNISLQPKKVSSHKVKSTVHNHMDSKELGEKLSDVGY